MSDDQRDVVKSKISMNFKPKSKATDTTIVQDSPEIDKSGDERDARESEVSQDKINKTSIGSKPQNIKDKPHKRKRIQPHPSVWILLVVLILSALTFLFLNPRSSGHSYYVESNILASNNETETVTLILSACIEDDTKQATEKELMDVLYAEYNYTKPEESLAQNLVSAGCDSELSIPHIKNVKASENIS